jgi:ligand-binding sensor domain-containing protein
LSVVLPVKNKTGHPKDKVKTEIKDLNSSPGPNSITRNIIQDRNGNIWIASFEGIIKYDGTSFTNITSKVSSARFFSVLEDRKGNFWFASVGSGIYYFDGKTFQNLTTKEGLASDVVTTIYEDKTGTIWFGTLDGVSRYDGTSFQNFTTKEGLPHNDVNTITEDKTGKFWIGTRGDASFYNGKTFTPLTHNGKPFTNVRSIIEDQKGAIWLGGQDGLWRYDGSIFTHFTEKFVGYIYEDNKGNIWTSSESANTRGWSVSRYDGNTLSNEKPTVTEVKWNEGMTFGILEANDESIWFGTLDGVYRYDGYAFNDFKSIQLKE